MRLNIFEAENVKCLLLCGTHAAAVFYMHSYKLSVCDMISYDNIIFYTYEDLGEDFGYCLIFILF